MYVVYNVSHYCPRYRGGLNNWREYDRQKNRVITPKYLLNFKHISLNNPFGFTSFFNKLFAFYIAFYSWLYVVYKCITLLSQVKGRLEYLTPKLLLNCKHACLNYPLGFTSFLKTNFYKMIIFMIFEYCRVWNQHWLSA